MQSIWTPEDLEQAIADAGRKCVLELHWEADQEEPKRRHYKVVHNELVPPHQRVHAPSFDPESQGFTKPAWMVFRIDLILNIPYLVYHDGRWYGVTSKGNIIQWWMLPRWVCPTIPYDLCKRLNDS